MANKPEENQFLALLQQNAEEVKSRIQDWMTPERFLSLARAILKDPKLMAIAKNNPTSLYNCVLEAADAGVEINTVNKHAVIIPYGNEAQLQIMWQGLVYRLIKAGVIKHAYADLVYKNDDIEVLSGSIRKLVHKPNPFVERGPLVGAYAVFTLPDDSTDFEIFTMKDIQSVKAAALRMAQRRDKTAGESPAWRFFEGEMIKKSVIRRGTKRLQARPVGLDSRLAAALGNGEEDFDAETTGEVAEDLPGMGATDEPPTSDASTPDGRIKIVPENSEGAGGHSEGVREKANEPRTSPLAPVAAPAAGRTVATATGDPETVRVTLTEDEQNALFQQIKKMGFKPSRFYELLNEKFKVTDTADLYQDQIEDVIAVFENAAAK